MATLPTEQRTKLQRTIVKARDIAEDGSRAALQAFAVHHHEPYGHMSPEERKLRIRLRAHGRQLGDKRDPISGIQSMDHIVNECAYEHWHRMLFARFLAENNLLIEPEMDVAISLDECEELSKEHDTDKWTLASRYAQQMLPQIFRPDNPVLQLRLAREHQLQLEQLLESLEPAVFIASDSLGWVYQFWQSKKKDEVNKSEVKIGADEIPAVTQLFTESYMVKFLLHNTIGAWYSGKVLARNPAIAQSAENEDQLRKAVSIPGCDWEYLRFVRTEDVKGPWVPAAGTFNGWPNTAAELKVMDPCCGSGHFLVEAFHLLIPIRMEEEGLSPREAVDAVLCDNLHGLEIDTRCIEIAVFALALAAWIYPDATGYRSLPKMSLACSGLAVSAHREEWLSFAEEDGRFRHGMDQLYTVFQNAPIYGSLIDPYRSLKTDLLSAQYEELQPLINEALSKEISENQYEIGIAAYGLLLAADLLSRQYHLVTTNVPYLKRGKQIRALYEYSGTNYPDSCDDLATAFLERCISLCKNNGTCSLVITLNWLFHERSKKLRRKLLNRYSMGFLSLLGNGAFETIGGAVVTVALISITKCKPRETAMLYGIDATDCDSIPEKRRMLEESKITKTLQSAQLRNPEHRIVLGGDTSKELLSKYADTAGGLQTFDKPRFIFNYWELDKSIPGWLLSQTTVDSSIEYGGCIHVLRWEEGKGQLYNLVMDMKRAGYSSGVWRAGIQVWGKKGILFKLMGELTCTLYTGGPFDNTTGVLIPKSEEYLPAMWVFCNDPSYQVEIRKIDKKVAVTNGNLNKVPFDFEHWNQIAKNQYPNGLPIPSSSDPTQWLFEGIIKDSDNPIMVAIGRLLGYQWPKQADDGVSDFVDEDGIVCIHSIRGEPPATDRIRELAHVAYGDSWSPAKEREFIQATGSNADSLDGWLRNDFFSQHCALFHHRPFIWHIWDGRKHDGFHALVNYHKLAEGEGRGRKLLEKLTNSYLGDWILRQQDGIERGVAGAEDRLVAALELKKRLEAIHKGERPYDIFVRWKPLAEQPIGWDPDINDGVRMNIRPFMASDIPGGRKGAGILRSKPNIKWGKDRGKEPMREQKQLPWFWKGGEFTGERVNDVHLTLEEKRQARAEAQEAEQ